MAAFHGGKLPVAKPKPYEINIALRDALQGHPWQGSEWGLQRFLCAHAIMLGLEGVPAFYIHSLLGTRNDLERLAHTSHNRSINRHQWELSALSSELDCSASDHHTVFEALKTFDCPAQSAAGIPPQRDAIHPAIG